MRILATLLTVAAFLVASSPCRADIIASAPVTPVTQPTSRPASAPHFIARGMPLTEKEIAGLSQRIVALGHISLDAGGEDDDVPAADAVFIGIVVIALIGGMVYLLVLESQQASKL